YLEQLKNLSPMMAGYVMTVHPLIMVLIAPIAGSLSDKHGAKKLLKNAVPRANDKLRIVARKLPPYPCF
ncbi:hypothetical protein, partial [Clostridioides difficile]|uniref:hypothetical protein n=1 Tax=Clostridioides difficile TaxID=1496 RepID=UPI00163D6523